MLRFATSAFSKNLWGIFFVLFTFTFIKKELGDRHGSGGIPLLARHNLWRKSVVRMHANPVNVLTLRPSEFV